LVLQVLRWLRQQTAEHFPVGARMQVSPEQAQFLAWLVKATSSRKALELGVFTGYSALSVALVSCHSLFPNTIAFSTFAISTVCALSQCRSCYRCDFISLTLQVVCDKASCTLCIPGLVHHGCSFRPVGVLWLLAYSLRHCTSKARVLQCRPCRLMGT